MRQMNQNYKLLKNIVEYTDFKRYYDQKYASIHAGRSPTKRDQTILIRPAENWLNQHHKKAKKYCCHS